MDTIPNLTILYGSQTGNAEDMAKRIGLQAKVRGLSKVQVLAVDDFQLKLLPKQKLVLFVCATTGHGQEPENMKNFYNFIRRRDLPSDCLKGLKFAVYGLGSSSYAKFNYVSKILFKRMKECGAEPIQELVASDEQHQFGCDGLIYPKLDELWKRLECERHTSSVPIDSGLENKFKNNSYSVLFYDEAEQVPSPSDKFSPEFKSKYTIREARCVVNQRLTPDSHFQDTRLFCYQTESQINYDPGDVCTIYPQNSEDNVLEFLRLLNLDPRKKFSVKKLDPNYMVNYLYDFIPNGLEIRDLVKYYLDIKSVPKRSFFEYLWPFSDDQMERDKLKEFASTEGQSELYEYCVRPKRTILETMLDFPKTVKNISFEYLFDLIPPMKPRSFSIASAASLHPNEFHLLVGVVGYKTNMKILRRGLCSNYLAHMTIADRSAAIVQDSSKLRFFIRKTSFKLPRDDEVPIVMVGPGLGLSPFRGFIQDRASRSRSRTTPTKSYLYFGCRFRDKDFYFQEELEDYANDYVIKLKVAFSRHEPKQYVQNLLAQDSQLISKLILEDNATIYVAGNSKLPEELRSLLGKILLKQTGDASPMQSGESEQIVRNLEATNRILYDCW